MNQLMNDGIILSVWILKYILFCNLVYKQTSAVSQQDSYVIM